MKVTYTGNTDYCFKAARKYRPEKVPSFDGIYSVKVSKVLAMLAMVQRLNIQGQRGYMITITFPPKFDNKERYHRRKLFLDVLRKMDNVVMYVWVTELHKKGKLAKLGLFHFHFYVITSEYWDYKSAAVRWSEKYSGNIVGKNGVDITPHTNPYYLAKYLVKDLKKLKWEKRLWGYKGVSLEMFAEMPIDMYEFYLEGRASCHTYSGMLKIHDKNFLAALYMNRTKYAKWSDNEILE